MKRFLITSVLICMFWVGVVYAIPPTPPAPTTMDLDTSTVAGLPAAPTTNDMYVVTDGSTGSDCTVGGGSTRVMCIYNGAAWVAFGDGTGGVGSGSVTTVEVGDVQVGGADIVTLDFNAAAFDVTESPDTEINITMDLTPSSGNATLVLEEDAIQVKYGSTLTESASGLDVKDDAILKAKFGDEDWGDMSVSSNSVTLDADVVAAAEMADADHGMVSWSSGVATVEDFALNTDADAGDFNIASIDRLEGVDTGVYIDMGADGLVEIVSDGTVDITAPNIKLEYDALAYLNIATADAGATTISQVSDGTDQIIIGDGGDRVDIASDTWDVTNGVITGVTSIDAATVKVTTLLDVDEDIDIDFDAADEEINITQAAVAGTEDVALIKITDARTGDTATETSEATIWIDAEGVYAIAAVDGKIYAEGGFEGALTGNVTGDLTGTASTASVATAVTITDNESTAETNAVIFTADAALTGGNLGLESDGDFHYNPSTGTVTATAFAGNLTGTVTGNASSASTFTLTSNADAGDYDITSVDKLEGIDDAVYIDMGTDGYIDLEADTGIRFNGPVIFANEGELRLPSTDASPDTTGEIRHDATVEGLATGALAWYDGDEVRYIVDLDVLPSDNEYVVAYSSADDKFYMKADADSGAAPLLNAIQNPDAATAITAQDTETITITTEQNTAGSFFIIDNTVADVTNNVYLLELQYTDDDDANAFFLKCSDNNGAEVEFSVGPQGVVSIGEDPADAGTIRLPNAGVIAWEDGTEATITHVDDTGFAFNLGIDVQSGGITLANDETITNATNGTISLSGHLELDGTDPHIFFDETDGTDWYLGTDDTGNTFEFRTNATIGNAVIFEMNEDGTGFTFGDNGDDDIVFTFNANTTDGVFTWMEDEDYWDFDDDVLISLDEKIYFGDTAVHVFSDDDGYLDLEADTGIRFNAPVTFANEGAITLPVGTAIADVAFTDLTAGDTYVNYGGADDDTIDELFAAIDTAIGALGGDVTGVGDCADGACLDGSDDGGSYIRLYDGDSNYLQFDVTNLTGDATIYFGGDTNSLYINNGTAILDIAAAATLNIDKSLTVGTNAGTLNFTAESKTLSVEDTAVVSQDYSSDATPTFAGIIVDSIDVTGEADLDIGSADVTDVTIVTDGGTIILDGTISASATAPELILSDSDDAAGTGALTFASANTQDIVGSIKVDVAGSATTYIEVDGVAKVIDLLQNVVIADGKSLTFDESAENPDDADVKLSATDGVLTIAAVNGANNENLTFDFDAAANTVSVGTGTGVTAVDFGAIAVAAGSLDASDGNITNVGQIDVDLVDADGATIAIGDGDETVTITSSDWTIDATGAIANASIDCDSNTLSNIKNANIHASAAIDATKIADGSVTSAEFQYIGTLSSDVQTQISNILDGTTGFTKATIAEMEYTGATLTIDVIKTDGASNLAVTNSNGSYVANMSLEGDLTVTGGDITLGTTSIFSGGDTASLNNIDAVDATTEATIEAAIDTLTNVTTVGGASSNTITIYAGANDQDIVLTVDDGGTNKSVTIDGSESTVDFGADNLAMNIKIHDAGTITMYEDGDDNAGVIIGPVADGTTTLGVTGSLNVSATVTAEQITSTDDIHLDGDSTVLAFGDDQDVTLTHVADTGLDMNSDLGFADGEGLNFGTGDDVQATWDNTNEDLTFTSAGVGTATTDNAFYRFIVDSGDAGMTANKEVFEIMRGSTELMALDEDGDLTVAGTIGTGPVDNAGVTLNQATAGDTDWWFGIAGDSEDDNDDPFEIGTGTTIGTNAVVSITPSGDVTADGSLKGTSFIMEGGTYDTTISPGTPTATKTYTWPLTTPASSGYALVSTTGGTMSWAEITATASGAEGNLQYNASGTLGAEAALSYNATNNTLSVTQAASNPTLQVGDGTYSWGHTPQVGIEGTVEVDGVAWFDNATEASAIGTAAMVLAGGLGVAKDIWVGDDVVLDSDSTVISLGADQDVTVTHVADTGVNIKQAGLTTDDKPIKIVLQTGEVDIAADDVLGGVYFQAPDEGTGTDAILVAAGIEAVSEGDFAADSNATKLSFKTGASETATEKMSLSSAGVLTVSSDVVVTGTDLTLGAAATGVKFTGSAEGVLTVQGLGSGESDESLAIDFDGTSNIVSITSASGVTEIDFNTINLATDALDLSEGDISNVGVIKADTLQPDAVADGSLVVQGGQTATNTLKLQAYDVDNTAFDDVVTITSGDTPTLTLAADGGITVSNTLALGSNDLTMTGSLAVTGSRVTKGWFTDLEVTNLPTVNGATIAPTNIAPVDTEDENATFYPILVDGATGTQATETDGEFTYNPSTDLLAVANATVSTQFKLPSSDADPTATAGYLRHDSAISNFTNGGLVYYNGAAIKQVVDITTATASACTDDQVVAYDADSDLWYCKNDADTGGATAWDDIGDPDADATVAFAGYEQTITSTLDEADHSVLTIYNTDADRANDTTILTLKDNDGADANAFYLKMIGDADGTPTTDMSVSQTAITSTLNFVTTGTIKGKIDVVADADGRNITKDTETLGTMHLATGAGTWLLPAMAAADGTGHSVCVYSTGANAVVVDTDGDKIRHNGTLLAAGYTITSASGAGNFVCLVLTDYDSDVAHWTTFGESGTWTNQTE